MHVHVYVCMYMCVHVYVCMNVLMYFSLYKLILLRVYVSTNNIYIYR